MKNTTWWAASSSAALLLALGSIHSPANAGEKSTCEGGGIYDSYQCFSLDADDVESTGTFVNRKDQIYNKNDITVPDRNDSYNFGYVEAYFVPSETRSGLVGNNSHNLDTTTVFSKISG